MKTLRNLGKQVKRKRSNSEKVSTVDPAFEEQRQKWIQTNLAFQSLADAISKQDSVKEFEVPSPKIAQLLSECFDEDSHLATFKQQFSSKHEKDQSVMKTFLQTQKVLADHLNSMEYIANARQYKKSIKERDNLLADFDKNKLSVETLKKKYGEENPDLFLAEQKLEVSKAVYERENEDLTKKLSELYDKRFFDFEPVFRKLISSHLAFFQCKFRIL